MTTLATASLPLLTLDYLKECLTIVNDIPAPLSPINNLSGYVELVKKEERKRKAESEDNSERAAKVVKAENGIALKLDGPSDGKVVNKTEERVFETKPWHPDQLRSMQERAEKHAREQKRQAEVHAASTSITTQETGALELADSVILFLFSFWTRGLRRHMERASRSGELESWLSTAAFAETTRKVARQHGRPFIPVVALLDLVEGMLLEHALVLQRRVLRDKIGAQIDRRDSAPTSTAINTPTLDAHTPSSVTSAHSPPTAATGRPVEQTAEHLKAFMRWSGDAERAQRQRSDALGGPLSSTELCTHLPQTWSRIIASPPMPLQACLELGEDLRFAWPLDHNSGHYAFGHLCVFARSVLTEVAAKRGLDWRGVSVKAS